MKGDFAILCEFCEQIGPRAVLTVPKDYCQDAPLNVDDFALRVMSVDFQTKQGADAENDTQIVITEKCDDNTNRYAYVHRFSLFDFTARGHVRPMCFTYLSSDYHKIITQFFHLRDRFTEIVNMMKESARVVFVRESEQYLQLLLHHKAEIVVDCEEDVFRSRKVQLGDHVFESMTLNSFKQQVAELQQLTLTMKSQQQLKFDENSRSISPRSTTNSSDSDSVIASSDNHVAKPFTVSHNYTEPFTFKAKSLDEKLRPVEQLCKSVWMKMNTELMTLRAHFQRPLYALFCDDIEMTVLAGSYTQPPQPQVPSQQQQQQEQQQEQEGTSNNSNSGSGSSSGGGSGGVHQVVPTVKSTRKKEAAEYSPSPMQLILAFDGCPTLNFSPNRPTAEQPSSMPSPLGLAASLREVKPRTASIASFGSSSPFAQTPEDEFRTPREEIPLVLDPMATGSHELSIQFGGRARVFSTAFESNSSSSAISGYPSIHSSKVGAATATTTAAGASPLPLFSHSIGSAVNGNDVLTCFTRVFEKRSEKKVNEHLLHYRRNCPEFIHIVFAILTGRCVVVYANSEHAVEASLCVQSLATFCFDESCIDKWRTESLKLSDLNKFSVIGLRKDVPIHPNLKHFICLLDWEKEELLTPGYEMMDHGELRYLLGRPQSCFDSAQAFLCHIHSCLLDLSMKAFLYYTYTQKAGSLTSSNYQQRKRLTPDVGLSHQDLRIAEYLSDYMQIEQYAQSIQQDAMAAAISSTASPTQICSHRPRFLRLDPSPIKSFHFNPQLPSFPARS